MTRRPQAVKDRHPRTPATSAARSSSSHRPRQGLRRSTKVLVSVGVVVTLVALGTQWTLRQSYFRVQHVSVLGARHESVAQIIDATGLEYHPTMFGVSTHALARDLTVFPWIQKVEITKHWPDTIEVRVKEAVPVAVAYNAKGSLRFVSAAGRDLGPAPLNANLPTLTYVHPRTTSWPYARAGVAGALVASQLPVAFSAQVSQITVDASGDVELKMTTPVTFYLGADVNLHAKFVAIASVIAHSTLRPGDVVDVSVPDELAVTGPAPS